ncbi:PQQ-dependent sugar dehydrogenase [Paludibaculum fermentans]|uniref:PQQ-dependent sugar dehydrogenase n=1 Tax=Paludibaculum fermentans TaxID=1473598 RepID=UPI003EB70E14
MQFPALLMIAVAALGTTAVASDPPKLPAPYQTPSASNGPKVVKQPDGVSLKVPAGFHVTEFASGFSKPRYLLTGPAGEILVSDSAAKGAVYALTDRNKDGRISDDEKKKLVGDLDRPYGLAIWKGYLYIAEATSIKRYKYDSAKQELAAGEEIIPLKGEGQGHWTRTLLFDKKGESLYMGIGSRSNITPGDPEYRAAILRYNPDGTQREVIAGGIRNPVGMDWNPSSGKLWASIQERDGLGDDLVPDYFTSIQPGAYYGWPYAYIGPNEEPRNKGQRPDLVAKTIVPDVILSPSHVAVLDARFYTGKQFPKKYQGGAFLAFHGSSNRASRAGYSVVFIPFKNGKPSGPQEDFLSGFMSDPNSKEVWGRPVGVLPAKDGSLLVSEDGGNKLWKITYAK